MTEGKVLVEWLGEVESEALKELRLQSHCAQTREQIKRSARKWSCQICATVWTSFPGTAMHPYMNSRLQAGRTHGFPLQLLILNGRRKTHVVDYISRLGDPTLDSVQDHIWWSG